MSQRGKKKRNRRDPAKSAAAATSPEPSEKPTKAAPRRPAPPKLVDEERIEAHRAEQRRRTMWYRTLVGAALLLVVGFISWFVYRNQLPHDIPDNRAKPPATYAVPQAADRTGISLGAANAPVTVDVFLDYECPHCREFERKTAGYFGKQVQSGTVKLVYHPISILNGYSVWAAAAAGCASDQGKLQQFTREVYRQEGTLDRDDLVTVGKNIGLNSPQFSRCVQDVTYKNWALGLTVVADAIGINSTPTVLVNGGLIDPRTAKMSTFIAKTKSAISAAAQPRQSTPAGR
ncbi:MAG: thioredoxin domain-containing protein [Mycobacteriales bacterium]